MIRSNRFAFVISFLSASLLLVGGAFAADASNNGKRPDKVAKISAGPTVVQWDPLVEHERLLLTVSMPWGEVWSKEFPAGKNPTFRIQDVPGRVIDGSYTWQLTVVPKIDPQLQREMERLREAGDDAALLRLRAEAGLSDAIIESGGFTILNGTFVSPDLVEPGAQDSSVSAQSATSGTAGFSLTEGPVQAFDQVIPDDLIVQGSACVGLDCVNNESFGFDTIRVKENNTRIQFDDTSSATGFATNNWQIRANASASGGQNFLGFVDQGATGNSESGTLVFGVQAGAAANSLWVSNTSRVGLRTATPVLDLHVNDTDTPGMRLEQNNAGGFTAQTWDIAGNEANFFIRDVTGGSLLPFRIRPGAPTSSIDIAASGNVGIGTTSPDAAIDVERTGGPAGFQNLLILNRLTGGPPGMLLLDGANNHGWSFRMTSGGNFRITDTSGAGAEDGVTEFDLTTNGDLLLAGSVNPPSSRYMKSDFEEIDSRQILEKVSSLWIPTWRYKHQDAANRHFGPVAEDFYEAFGVGIDAEHLSPSDAAGVALAAIQGLHHLVREKDQQIRDLEQKIEQLSIAVATLIGDE